MRLVTYRKGGRSRIGVHVDDKTILDIRAADALKVGRDRGVFTTMLELIDDGEGALDLVRELHQKPDEGAMLALSDVQLLAPIPVPVQMRDCLVFEEHLKNSFERVGEMMGKKLEIPPVWYEQPIYYKCNRMSVIGPGRDVHWPAFSQMMDFELEMAIVIGKTGRDISVEDAPKHIFGYTIFNDMTARDTQAKEMSGQLGPAKGKDFDTGNILGPCIVTADEIEHPAALEMEVKVNGERWGGGNSSMMHHSFADIIAHISSSETLYEGEVIGSGTVGTGCGLELGRFLSPGDVMELTIEKIGTLTNRITRAG